MATLWLQDAPTPSGWRWLGFEHPLAVLETRRSAEVPALLDAVADAVASGLWAVGFLAYEAAPAFDPAMKVHEGVFEGPPLAWWGLFRGPLEPVGSGAPPFLSEMSPENGPGAESRLDWRPALDAAAHARAIHTIRGQIAAGETYQVNYTFPFETPFDGDPRRLFARLWNRQRPSYGAYLEPGREEDGSGDGGPPWAICSVSPELFFRFDARSDGLDGGEVVSRPMKGTSRRAEDPAEDRRRLEELSTAKNRAENLMIVDMMRNDLGRIAEPGSVRVRRLFGVETYPTVHQMVSEVRAHTKTPALDVLKALFPCASITGAPKIRTMELIRELEPGPRGVYTGTVGYLAPDGTAQFNVAIRTAVVGRRCGSEDGRGWARYGTGGGIVWDSVAADEYRECLSKALILDPDRGTSSEDADFHLFETLLHRPRSGFFLLDRHLERLEASARTLGFPWDGAAVRQELEALRRRLPPERARVRLEWHRRDSRRGQQRGWARVEAWPFPCTGRTSWTAVLDDRPVDADDPFLRHKTSRRERYESAAARFPEADEVVLHNGAGQLTETTRANLVLRFGDRFLTPPVAAGLLPGTYRAALLARGRLEEADLPVAALAEADAIFAVNSLRGWVRLEVAGLETIAPGPAESRAMAGLFRRTIRPSAEPGKQTPTPFPAVHGEIR